MSDNQKIKQALDRSIRTVTLRPERGRRVYRNVAVVEGGTRCEVEEAGQTYTLDVGKALGGEGVDPNPSMMFRSAFSSCVAIGIRQSAARAGVPVDRVQVILETDVDARGQLGVCENAPPGFEAIRLTVAVASTAPQAAVDDVVAASLKYSPLMDAISNPQPIECRISVIGPDAPSLPRENR